MKRDAAHLHTLLDMHAQPARLPDDFPPYILRRRCSCLTLGDPYVCQLLNSHIAVNGWGFAPWLPSADEVAVFACRARVVLR